MRPKDKEYLKIILDAIRVCTTYKPRFGKKGEGLSLEQFQDLYGNDLFYSWFGLDNPMMYAAHKTSGGMTSVYRQIGKSCEDLFRTIIKDSLDLSDDNIKWSYEKVSQAGRKQKIYLDARIDLNDISDPTTRDRFHGWMRESAALLGVKRKVFNSFTGAVFEIRQGYKSKDTK